MSRFDSRRPPLPHERVPVPDIYVKGYPTLVFDRGTIKRTGREALKDNIRVAKSMMELVKTLFGPRRLIKLVVSEEGRSLLTFVSSDLKTLLRKVKLEHPVAQLIAGAACAVLREKGDGSVSTILLAGKILEKSEHLVDQGINPAVLIDGLVLAYKKIIEVAESLALDKSFDLLDAIRLGIRNSLVGKLLLEDVDHISKLVFDAINFVGMRNVTSSEGTDIIDVKKIPGESIRESHVINGIALAREIPHMYMPRRIEGARIAVLKGELRIPNKKLTRYMDYRFVFDTTEQFQKFESSKRAFLKDLTDPILKTDANVIMIEKGMDDILLEYFSRLSILVIWRFPPPEFDRVSKAVGANMVAGPENLAWSDLGWADLIEAKKITGQDWIYVTGCKEPKTVDIILRGVSKYLLDEIERNIKGAVTTSRTLADDPRLVWGGGAFEEEVASSLYDYSEQISDKKQLVVEAVAEAFESIPALLGQTVGLNEIDVVTQLRSMHRNGERSTGVDVLNSTIGSMIHCGVMDSLAVKLQVIKAAFEVAMTVLRVDEYILARKLSEPERHYVQRIKGTSSERLKEEHSDIEALE